MANQVDNPNLLAKERDDEIDKLLKIQEEIEKNKKELENDLENSELKEAIERQNKEAANLKNRISVIDKKLKEVKKASENGKSFKHPNVQIDRALSVSASGGTISSVCTLTNNSSEEDEEILKALPHPNILLERNPQFGKTIQENLKFIGHPNIRNIQNEKNAILVNQISMSRVNIASRQFPMADECSEQSSRESFKTSSSCRSASVCTTCGNQMQRQSKVKVRPVSSQMRYRASRLSSKLTKGTSCQSFDFCNKCGNNSRKVKTSNVRIKPLADSSCDTFEDCIDCGKDKSKSFNGISSNCSRQLQMDEQSSGTTCNSFKECGKCKETNKSCKSMDICNKCANKNITSGANPSCESFDVCQKCKSPACQSRDNCSKCQVNKRVEPSCDSLNICSKCANKNSCGSLQATKSCESSNICDACKKGVAPANSKCSTSTKCRPNSSRSIAKSQQFMFADETKNPSKSVSQVSRPKSITNVRSKLSTIPSCDSVATTPKKSISKPFLVQKEKLNCRPEAPQTPGRQLLTLKKNRKEFDELECPDKPCESNEKRNFVKTPRPKPKDKKSMMTLNSEKESKGDMRSVTSQGKGEANPPKEDFSSRYLKMKYEIEMQNYLIDKMHRELEAKMMNCRPEFELCQLQQKMDLEVVKLGKMIEFAICIQRLNPEEKWGSIPISTVGQCKPMKTRSCPRLTKKLKLPQTPSGISLVSGFDELEDILLKEDEENCLQEVSRKLKEERIQDLCGKMGEMACKFKQLQEERLRLESEGCNRDIKCSQLFNGSCQDTDVSDDEVKAKLLSIDQATKQLLCNVDKMKCKTKNLLQDFSSFKQTNQC